MINDEIKHQTSGDNSTNIQAQNIIIHNGITNAEAREIALDIYNANFMKLSEEAALTALSRVESFTDKCIKKIFDENLEYTFQSPELQYVLFNAQKECARSSDENLEEILSNILIDRAKEYERGLKQIALEESISIIPKLTNKHMDILTLNYLLNDCYFQANSTDNLQKFLSKSIIPFKAEIDFSSQDIRHMQFTGSLSTDPLNKAGLQFQLPHTFPGLFSKGFTIDEYKKDVGEDEKYTKLLTECIHDKTKYQLNGASIHSVYAHVKTDDYSKEDNKNIYE
ncbi:MAG: LPO_1073/Vpar_1526 family protein [Sulfurimonas sp.]|jgi:hypothetical protein